MMLFMSINWPIEFKTHICRFAGGLSCDMTANHVIECYLSASIKDWQHSELFPLAFTITASISLGENISPPLRSLITMFWIDIYAMYFRLPFSPPSAPLSPFFGSTLCYVFSLASVGRLFRPTFAENDNIIITDIVNN